MRIKRECLACGAAFEGRPNRAYCSARCKDREKMRRRRIRFLEASLSNAHRSVKVAELRNDRNAMRVAYWRIRQLQSEIEELTMAPNKTG